MAVTYDPPPVPMWGPLDDDGLVTIVVEGTAPVGEPDAAPVGAAGAEDGVVDPYEDGGMMEDVESGGLMEDVEEGGMMEDVEDVGVDPAVA